MASEKKGNMESLAFSVILHFKIKASGSSSQRYDRCNTIWLLKIQETPHCPWPGLHWSQVMYTQKDGVTFKHICEYRQINQRKLQWEKSPSDYLFWIWCK